MRDLDRRTLLYAALAVALALAAGQWLALPLWRAAQGLDREMAAAEAQLAEARRLVAGIGRMRAAPATASASSLFARLEQLADREALRPRIESMRPSVREVQGRREEVVELRLAGVGLERFTAFLAAVEASGARVERLNLRASENKPLDAEVLVSAGGGG
jgi:cytosine/adenosine deaminase-related metal-dependent hydrolase